ncbi:DALR anticodon-binding domain-containing protein 3-like isoform X3 [Physella acuta]|uniref:DALR anticodon-binding domain-containing protein 3-like isoform X2 n=1 Tax=Physella acuta TaxID=109671 RepID=UPI0027DC4EDE|nr:DALR anticodon-binding domain-containing protein 3-like isoform X2 [Physella acuta]XP_059175878.1 DALR anticodon-binding domain-containing protein 3-like isoform X3 [Physella acuta]
MSTNMADTGVENVVDEIRKIVSDEICNMGVEIDSKTLDIKKNNKELKRGDIIIPAGSVKLVDSRSESLQKQLLLQTEKKIKENNGLLKDVVQNKNCFLAFYFNRPKFCSTVIKQIEELGSKYGFSKTKTGQEIFLNTVLERSEKNKSNSCVNSLTDLRVSVVQCHLKKLLEANGYDVYPETVSNPLSLLLENSTSCDTKLGEISQSKSDNLGQDMDELSAHFVSKAKILCTEQLTDLDPNLNAEVDLDLQKVIAEKNLYLGKEGFDKNLNKVKVLERGVPTWALESAIDISRKIRHFTSKQNVGCLHIVPQNMAFRQQQVEILSMALCQQQFIQAQLVVGPVTSKSKSEKCPDKAAQDFLRVRYEQMKEASKMRSSSIFEDQSKQIEELTFASVIVDLLTNSVHTSLHLDTNGEEQDAETRQGAFIMYNTARLATLMEHFNQGVSTGMYPPLPSVDNVDFSLLREEEDWELVYLFLAAFPDVVRQAVEVVFPTGGRCSAKVHTHKITNFLVSFSTRLSAHYSRYHVLASGEPHLLPLMYARLYLMKSAHQLLVNCLHLIGVKALSYL